jgi:hypothetical protein
VFNCILFSANILVVMQVSVGIAYPLHEQGHTQGSAESQKRRATWMLSRR